MEIQLVVYILGVACRWALAAMIGVSAEGQTKEE